MKTLKVGADERHVPKGTERSENDLRALRDAVLAQARRGGASARWRGPDLTKARLQLAKHAATRVTE